MLTMKITTKRQATLPVEVCKTLGITAGDTVELMPVLHKNETIWALKPVVKPKSSWIGSLNHYARKSRRPWSREEFGDLAGRALSEASEK